VTEPRLGNNLKVYRAMRDWTQAELAERIGVSRKTINTIETGRFIPSTVTALLIARAFEAALEDLYYLNGQGAAD
jgi:putative transcriptional regulator